MLTVFRYVRNDDYRGAFIDKAMYVGDLKDAIKEKTKPIFNDIPAYSSYGWLPLNAVKPSKKYVEELYLGQSLEAYEILSDISWSGLGEKGYMLSSTDCRLVSCTSVCLYFLS